MSTHSEIQQNIEVLKQTMRDAKRLKKELASQIGALDEKLKRIHGQVEPRSMTSKFLPPVPALGISGPKE